MGNAAAIDYCRGNPPRMENGFEEILSLGWPRPAWIESKWLMPFPTAQFPRGNLHAFYHVKWKDRFRYPHELI